MALRPSKVASLHGRPAAGIYSDMTVDGPEIGTLVVIIDRAKNLPNRKSMGKQDPYCAARLGKEAKKTETDKRGGQTPKCLKLSVFNDDKRTELIGEAWVSLDDVVVPGGGQSDMWQNLGCKGKYAGDVRLEITYYDTRPKPEKPKEPVHPEQQFDEQRDRVNSGVAGPRRDTPIKRRPLPSNPTSASQSPNVDVDHGRPLPNPSSGPRSYQTPPSTRNSRYDAASADYPNGTVRRKIHPQYDVTGPEVGHSIPRSRSPRPYLDEEEYIANDPSGMPHWDQQYPTQGPHDPSNPPQYDAGQSGPHGFGHGHFPPEADHYRPPQYPTQEDMSHQPPPPLPQADTAYSSNRVRGQSQYGHFTEEHGNNRQQHAPEQRPRSSHYPPQPYVEEVDAYGGIDLDSRPRRYHSQEPEHRQLPEPTARDVMQPSVEDAGDLPPPPPVHRSTGPGQVGAPQSMVHRASYVPSPEDEAPAPLRISNRNTMEQPVVPYDGEDPSSPGMGVVRYSERAAQQRISVSPRVVASRLEDGDPVNPLDLSRSHNGGDMRDQTMMSQPQPRPQPSERPPSYNSERYVAAPHAHRPTYPGAPPAQPLQHPRSHGTSPFNTPPHQVPYQSRTNSVPDYRGAETNGSRQSMSAYETPPLIKPRAVSPVTPHSGGPVGRPTPPTNRSTPSRRPVSPLPPPQSADSTGSRGGLPFSPDSYDAFNPHARPTNGSNPSTPNDSFRTSTSGPNNYDTTPSKSRKSVPGPAPLDPKPSPLSVSHPAYDPYEAPEPIIDAHGRPIDPSDHLPISAWAPEPERKAPLKERPFREREKLTGAREPGSRTRPGTASSSSTPQSLAARGVLNSVAGTDVVVAPSSNTGRNRLQKRSRPQSAMVVVQGHHTHSAESSPVPVPPGYLRERGTGGYHSAGASPVGGGGGRYEGGGHRASYAGPPIPAKVPLEGDGEGAGGSLAALSAEMSRIDIGAVGRRNQHGRRVGVGGY